MRPLSRHLALAIAAKLLALAGLWWFLVREHAVETSTEQTAAHLLVPAADHASSASPPGTPQ
jgi:hypothetical protein